MEKACGVADSWSLCVIFQIMQAVFGQNSQKVKVDKWWWKSFSHNNENNELFKHEDLLELKMTSRKNRQSVLRGYSTLQDFKQDSSLNIASIPYSIPYSFQFLIDKKVWKIQLCWQKCKKLNQKKSQYIFDKPVMKIWGFWNY